MILLDLHGQIMAKLVTSLEKAARRLLTSCVATSTKSFFVQTVRFDIGYFYSKHVFALHTTRLRE